MNRDDRLAELLLCWQEAQEQGKPVSLAELAEGDSSLEAELQRRIDSLQAMQWMEKLQSATTRTATNSSGAARPRFWNEGQEPVPGYRLVKLLGRGGFSEVWEASGPSGIPVAMKLIFADRSLPEEKSLELLKTIRHPRIVSIFGAWPVEKGFALAMELADESLYDRWCKLDTDDAARVSLSKAALIAGAEALDDLNIKHHIQHRDVKPQNMLMFGDYIKLADFGIAKVVEDHSTGHTGYFTVAYAPPEFFRGRSASSSDQYSLAVMYTLLRSGRLPFVGNSAQITYSHLHRGPDLAALPREEQSAVLRALSKEPKDRWPSCKAFAEAVFEKRSVFLQPKTRRQLIKVAAAVAIGAVGYLTWPSSKPVELRLRRRFDKPSTMQDKNEALQVQQVVATRMAVRKDGQLINSDYYVVGNGLTGAYVWNGDTGQLMHHLTKTSGYSVALPGTERRWCLTGDNYGTFYKWSLVTGANEEKILAHAEVQVRSVDISSNTIRNLTASTDSTIKIWELSKSNRNQPRQ